MVKFVTYTRDGESGVGLMELQGILPLQDAFPELSSMVALIRGWDGLREKITAYAAAGHGRLAASEVQLAAPIPRPGKIMAIGLNYRDHIEEAHLGEPQEPIWFCKQGTSVNGPFDPIPLPKASSQVDYEAEMVTVIGRGGRNIAPEDALDAVFGYCCGNDVSCRDWQMKTPQWTLSKGSDGHAPFGPAITTADEVGDPQALDIRGFVNGELRQNSNTKHMVYSVRDQIACLSQLMTLEPGDIIFTGTPGGVAMGMENPQWLQDGDSVRVEIAKLGAIEALCRAES